MFRTVIKIPAKINLTLDIVGKEDGYHQINSLCSTISVYDYIILKKRSDRTVTLRERGRKSGTLIEDNNAYKAVKLYMRVFHTNGVDIILKKNIPVGGGFGGSSADIAGVLIGMKKLFGFDNIKPLADALGSDCGYMLTGGFATISGRGEIVDNIESTFSKKETLPLIIFTAHQGISSKESYQEYDRQKIEFKPTTEKAVDALKVDDMPKFYNLLKNDLFYASNKLVPSISKNIYVLKNNGAKVALMTGSGSAVYGVFGSKKERDEAYKKLKKKYKNNIIKANTL